MKYMDDPVKDFCKRRRYANFVTEGGLDYLVPSWERTVANVAVGWNTGSDSYLNFMDTRNVLYEVLQVATAEQLESATERILKADQVFLDSTNPVQYCLWGRNNEIYRNWNPVTHWWYYRVPKLNTGADWHTFK